jgi:epoxyqueuosine reductase QueG
MESMNGPIAERAKALGFDDIRFARADGDITDTSGKAVSVQSLLPGAESVIVLFSRYVPAREPLKGSMALSPYYVASNNAYGGAKRLAAFIESEGGAALHTASISAREAALRTGGFIGDNGFYYHETYGSLVCIQTILTNAARPGVYGTARRECLHCSKCRSGCPSGGVGNTGDCLRRHMHGVVPEALRGGVYELFGCEKCQSACPLNTSERGEPYEFGLEGLLGGEYTAELKRLAGGNMARARRIISQAALYAANTNARGLAEKLKALAETAEEPALTHIRWAYSMLTGEHDDNA